ncbi:hypothetical protein PR001_g2937 [Phytophthora rubi]|uniref:Uncharacterized protein n=1 Tax=Phytophthora rubi TaxID=129364 RepID=A0A6A3P8A9_9STRA|nr:hypothetical protein PR001_g2937 [Phytophthora rubi]
MASAEYGYDHTGLQIPVSGTLATTAPVIRASLTLLLSCDCPLASFDCCCIASAARHRLGGQQLIFLDCSFHCRLKTASSLPICSCLLDPRRLLGDDSERRFTVTPSRSCKDLGCPAEATAFEYTAAAPSVLLRPFRHARSSSGGLERSPAGRPVPSRPVDHDQLPVSALLISMSSASSLLYSALIIAASPRCA